MLCVWIWRNPEKNSVCHAHGSVLSFIHNSATFRRISARDLRLARRMGLCPSICQGVWECVWGLVRSWRGLIWGMCG